MICEPLNLFAKPIGVKLFNRIHHARVDFTATFVEYPTVCDVVSKRVLERILQIRKKLCRIEKLGSLQTVRQATKLVFRQPANCLQETEWDFVSDNGRLLQ